MTTYWEGRYVWLCLNPQLYVHVVRIPWIVIGYLYIIIMSVHPWHHVLSNDHYYIHDPSTTFMPQSTALPRNHGAAYLSAGCHCLSFPLQDTRQAQENHQVRPVKYPHYLRTMMPHLKVYVQITEETSPVLRELLLPEFFNQESLGGG